MEMSTDKHYSWSQGDSEARKDAHELTALLCLVASTTVDASLHSSQARLKNAK